MEGKSSTLRSLENIENNLEDIGQNFYSRDLGLIDRSSGLKYSQEDKIKNLKLIG